MFAIREAFPPSRRTFADSGPACPEAALQWAPMAESRWFKVALAIIGVVLMLVFVLPAGIGSMAGHGGDVGEVDGQDVTFADVQQSRGLLSAANRILLPVGEGAGQLVPLPALLGPQVAQDLGAEAETFHLLRFEAARDGLDVPLSAVESYLLRSNAKVRIGEANDEPIDFALIDGEGLRQTYLLAAKSVLDVQAAAEAYADFFKVSAPLADFQASVASQALTLQAAGFDAADYLGRVETPSDAQVAEHFGKYAATPPGVVTDDNPFGFGYRRPDAVRIEYLTVSRDAAEAVARRDLLDQPLAEREADLYGLFRNNRPAFPAPATRPATRPTTMPAEGDALLAAENPAVAGFLADQAAKITGDAAEEWAAYTAVHDEVVNAYVRREASRLADATLKRARDALAGDFRSLRAAARKDEPAPETRAGVPADDAEYLPRVADAVAERTGLRPEVTVLRRDLLPVSDLADPDAVGPIAGAFLVQGGQAVGTLAQYVATQLDPILSPERREAARGGPLLLELFQPGEPLVDPQLNAYVLRVVDARDDAPPADVGAVREQVVQDLRLRAAYDLALADARAFAQAGDFSGGNVETVGPFLPLAGPPPGTTALGTAPLPPAALIGLARGAYALTPPASRGATAGEAGVIDLPSLRHAAAARVVAVEPTYADATDRGLRLTQVTAGLTDQLRRDPAARAEFFDPDRVAARVGFDSARDDEDDEG